MPRPTWSGAISFGLVNVPDKAYSAAHDDIEKGFEVSKGKYVVVDEDEFEALRPESTRSIDITDFVELESVDPIYYENA